MAPPYVFTGYFKVIEPPRRPRHDLFRRVWTSNISMYMYSVYPSHIPGKVWRMGLLGAWTAACWFLLALSRSRICSAAPFVQSALCPLLSRFIPMYRWLSETASAESYTYCLSIFLFALRLFILSRLAPVLTICVTLLHKLFSMTSE